jgi:hypothetical protein
MIDGEKIAWSCSLNEAITNKDLLMWYIEHVIVGTCGVLSFKIDICVPSEHTTHINDGECVLNCFLYGLICCVPMCMLHDNHQTNPMMIKLLT